MNKARQKFALDRPATRQIRVAGHLDESWSDWVREMTISVESEGDGPPITTLTGFLDQAAIISTPQAAPAGSPDPMRATAVY